MIRLSALLATLLLTTPALAKAPCGGSFPSFVKGLKNEAASRGHAAGDINKFFASAKLDSKVIKADRSQGVFKRTFSDFAGRVISTNRMQNGKRNAGKQKTALANARRQFGVDPSVMLAFWALETDYGAVQGNFNTLNALVTLSHDCRRPDLFRPQIFAALELYTQGNFSPTKTVGAWAGEIGMIQMLPADILRRGVDGDGDGRVRLKTSAPDAIMTGARLLKEHGWRAGEPWLVEVTVPSNLDWSRTGLDKSQSVANWKKQGVNLRSNTFKVSNGMQASVLLPEGRNGPAFLALPNFHVFFEWNKSFVYVTTAAYFATRLAGAPRFNKGNPSPSLSDGQMKSLQKKLKKRGHDVGKVDGILGAKTRAAVQKEQVRLGLPADAWPTKSLLGKL